MIDRIEAAGWRIDRHKVSAISKGINKLELVLDGGTIITLRFNNNEERDLVDRKLLQWYDGGFNDPFSVDSILQGMKKNV